MNSRHSNSVKRKIKHTTLNWFKQIRNRKLELKYMLLSLTRHRNPRSILQSLLLTVLRIASLNYWESERGRDRKLLKIFSCLFAGQCREEREFREWDVFVKNYYIIIFLPILFFSFSSSHSLICSPIRPLLLIGGALWSKSTQANFIK